MQHHANEDNSNGTHNHKHRSEEDGQNRNECLSQSDNSFPVEELVLEPLQDKFEAVSIHAAFHMQSVHASEQIDEEDGRSNIQCKVHNDGNGKHGEPSTIFEALNIR